MSVLLDRLPYARFLGLVTEEHDGALTVTMRCTAARPQRCWN